VKGAFDAKLGSEDDVTARTGTNPFTRFASTTSSRDSPSKVQTGDQEIRRA
jgi:hypothetical protein